MSNVVGVERLSGSHGGLATSTRPGRRGTDRAADWAGGDFAAQGDDRRWRARWAGARGGARPRPLRRGCARGRAAAARARIRDRPVAGGATRPGSHRRPGPPRAPGGARTDDGVALRPARPAPRRAPRAGPAARAAAGAVGGFARRHAGERPAGDSTGRGSGEPRRRARRRRRRGAESGARARPSAGGAADRDPVCRAPRHDRDRRPGRRRRVLGARTTLRAGADARRARLLVHDAPQRTGARTPRCRNGARRGERLLCRRRARRTADPRAGRPRHPRDPDVGRATDAPLRARRLCRHRRRRPREPAEPRPRRLRRTPGRRLARRHPQPRGLARGLAGASPSSDPGGADRRRRDDAARPARPRSRPTRPRPRHSGFVRCPAREDYGRIGLTRGGARR